MTKSVLIVGAGLGLSSSLAKCCADQGMKVALAARTLDKLEAIAGETNAELYQCDASSDGDVVELFAGLDASIGTPEMVIYNPSARVHGPVQELDPVKVQHALNTTCYGAFLVAQQAAQSEPWWKRQAYLSMQSRLASCAAISAGRTSRIPFAF